MRPRIGIKEQVSWAAVVGLVLVGACAEGQLKAPAQLTPIGDTAYYGRRVIQAVQALQDTAVQGEEAKVFTTEDARVVVSATKVAGQAGVDLADALKAGLSGATARDKAIVTIRTALQTVPNQLSPHAREVVAPYIQVVLTLLTVFGATPPVLGAIAILPILNILLPNIIALYKVVRDENKDPNNPAMDDAFFVDLLKSDAQSVVDKANKWLQAHPAPAPPAKPNP